jgi:polyhydroxyalkanoate synthesis repressor PhaR
MKLRRGSGDKILIKKYGNRRLYDTHNSRYVTLGEVAELVRGGADARVIDAKSNEDLTQGTLMQIILDGRGAAQLLPVDLLTQLVRMEDEALAEFLGRYMTFALEVYMQVKHGAQAIAPWNPLATMPFAAANNLARLFTGVAGPAPDGEMPPEPEPEPEPEAAPAPEPAPPAAPLASQMQATSSEVADLRRELAELKQTLTHLAATAGKK